MNYYEHHIRDYDAATAHLTWDEDMAYARLIRWYYRKERPVPSDIKEACRQVRATSKTQRDAVAVVLREFFYLRDDGWHNENCDELIAKFKDGEPEREVKKANEENRLKRHRDERARLFKTLTDAGEHAAWNIKIEDLRELVKAVAARSPETKTATPATAPATPATATQAPSTNHQSPVVNPKDEAAASEHSPPDAAASPIDPISHRAIELSVLLRQRGAALQASSPTVRAWAERGVTDAQILTAMEVAEQRRANQNNPQPVNAGYLDSILADASQARTASKGKFDPVAFVNQSRKDANELAIDSTAERVG